MALEAECNFFLCPILPMSGSVKIQLFLPSFNAQRFRISAKSKENWFSIVFVIGYKLRYFEMNPNQLHKLIRPFFYFPHILEIIILFYIFYYFQIELGIEKEMSEENHLKQKALAQSCSSTSLPWRLDS